VRAIAVDAADAADAERGGVGDIFLHYAGE
jgi:hypothetical protein